MDQARTSERPDTVNLRKQSGRIAVANAAVDGVRSRSAMPTFLVNTAGLASGTIESELDAVATLQTIAPVFRIVVITDRPLFNRVRAYEWPVEHLMPIEHQGRLLPEKRSQEYLNVRLDIACAHYERAEVVEADAGGSFAEVIANRLDLTSTWSAVASLSSAWSSSDDSFTSTGQWAVAERSLRQKGNATYEGSGGRVVLTADGGVTDSLFVTGFASEEGNETAYSGVPDSVTVVRALFDSAVTEEFESHVYSALARSMGRGLSVVQPWRMASVLLDDSLFWIDLSVGRRGGRLQVLPEYSESYSVLEPELTLDWNSARQYAAVRRISRLQSKRKGAFLGHF